MSRKRKKTTPLAIPSDELGHVIEEETGISLSDLEASLPGDDMPAAQAPSLPTSPPSHTPSDAPEQAGDSTLGHAKKNTDDDLQGMAEEYEGESHLGRIIASVMGIVGILLVVGIIVFGIFISRLLDARKQAEIAGRAFIGLEQSIANLDFRSALDEFPKGHAAIQALAYRVGQFRFAESIPWIGSSIHETYAALGVLDRMFTASQELLSLVSRVGKIIFRENGEKTFEAYMRTLSIEEKGTILRMASQAVPTLNGVKASLQLAIRDSDGIDQSRISSQLRDALARARAGADTIQSSISAWLPLVEVMPAFLGYPQEKTYLLLLQDTSELRATGGFISHYGILKIYNGEITLLKTDNVYNLDDRGERFVSLPPPGPVGQYFSASIKKWFFRDANWSPDFAESARQAEGLYYLEGGSAKHIDGVIAATPEVVRSLLRFIGPIRIEGRDYNADTMLENLAFEVREGNYRRGISETERKEIFGQLIARMGERLLEIPLTRWVELYTIVEARLHEKNLLLYFHDPTLQAFARQRNWTGEIRQTEGDFLMVVDTTIGTLKTESVMDKQVQYTMREDPDGFLVGRVELTYKNNGTYSDVTTRYRDWVRILVPAGSTLVSSSGAQISDDKPEGGTLEIVKERGTMQFGAYITVEPRYTKVFSLEYRLPSRIYERLKRDGGYSLLLQKQPGSAHTRFQGNFMFLSPVAHYAPFGFFNARRFAQNLDVFSDMRTDQEFTVQLEKQEDKK
ncbi:DUF4012 domain-containing protein [Candidatus Uhrbacteria bacterium]|nr:DUF4012 domain-containing protein [Candidatus Uhrbacteria bacterium]